MGKENILSKIKANKPALVPLPDIPKFNWEAEDLVEQFIQSASANASHCYQEVDTLENLVTSIMNPDSIIVGATTLHHPYTSLNKTETYARENIDLLMLDAPIGVAENGSLWVEMERDEFRVMPFIVQHLMLIVKAKDIVANMHLAYDRIDFSKSSFGVFISGPSKTADIEQALVIGAQASRSLHIVII